MVSPGVVPRSDLDISVESGRGVALTTAMVVEPVQCNEDEGYIEHIREYWPISQLGQGYDEVLDIEIGEEDDDVKLTEGNSHNKAPIVEDDDPLISVRDHLLLTQSEPDDTVDSTCQNATVVYENSSCTQREHNYYCVGDIVWVDSETISWWPGRIYDPVRGTFPGPQFPGRDIFLVRYLGREECSLFWRNSTQLKHFSDGYDQFSRKNNQSTEFHKAVKKAVEEVRRRARASVGCPCLCGGTRGNWARREASFIPFEPREFLYRLKLASFTSMVPNKIEIIILESFLWAFYSFVGHCHLPFLCLDDSVVAEDNVSFDMATMAAGGMNMFSSRKKLDCRKRRSKEESAAMDAHILVDGDGDWSKRKIERGYESRERKRSKYLSPPYVDVNFRRKCASENSTAPIVMQDSSSFHDRDEDKSSVIIGLAARPCSTARGGHVRKRKMRKLSASSPSEMLDLLRLMAAGGCFSAGNGFLSSIPDLFFRFRNSVFRGGSDYGVHGEREFGMLEESGTDTDSLGRSSGSGGQQLQPENRKVVMRKRAWEAQKNSAVFQRREGMSDSKKAKPKKGGDDRRQGNSESSPPALDRLEWKQPLAENLPDLNQSCDPNSTALVVMEGKPDVKTENPIPASPSTTPGSSGDQGTSSSPRQNGGRSEPENQRPSITTTVPDLNRGTGETHHLSRAGNTLLLSFEEGYPPPTKEALLQSFCSFGELVESETEQGNGAAEARVGFLRSCDAGEAFRSLEKTTPFGSSLVKYRLQHQAGATRPSMEDHHTTSASPLLIRPAVFTTPVKTVCGEAPVITEATSLPFIRRNLEVMTEVLQRSGDNLSPETRAKLEGEIKGLLKKVSTMAGSITP